MSGDTAPRKLCGHGCELPAGHHGPHQATFEIPASPDWTGSPEQWAEWNRRVAEGAAVRWIVPDTSPPR